VLGHLLDSALNNHNRFVRAALDGEYRGPNYEQEPWVELHGYRDADWNELLQTWQIMNRRLAGLVARIPAGRYASMCVIGNGPPVTLQFLIEDYLSHLNHHIEQIAG